MHCEDVTAQKVTYMAWTRGVSGASVGYQCQPVNCFQYEKICLIWLNVNGHSRIHSLFTSAFEEFLRA